MKKSKEELHSMDDEVECNMCGGYMYLLPDNSIYVCTNSECTRCYEEEDEEPKQAQKQHLIDMMKLDEELGLYNEEIKFEDVFNEEKKQGVKELIDKHKQETLEKILPKNSNGKYSRNEIEKAFELGAKLQQERMYSEEEFYWGMQTLKMELSTITKEEIITFNLENWFKGYIKLKKKQ